MKTKKRYTRPTAIIIYSGVLAEADVVSQTSVDTAAPDSGMKGQIHGVDIGDNYSDGNPPSEAKQTWGCHWDLWDE